MEECRDLKEKFMTVKAIAEKYQLELTDIDEVMEGMDNFKITAPVIGNFSTGKSSLLNAILGKKLLDVDVTPETAIPKEIYYGDNVVHQIYKGQVSDHSIAELPINELTVSNTDCIQIELKHEFLAKIQSVKIVDLPGFNSSIAVHNEAIDKYLPNSMAYILVVSSDEPVIKNNIYEFLKEIKIFNVPVYIVLTKCSRLSEEEINECKTLLKKLMMNIFDEKDIKIGISEAYGTINVEEVKQFFYEIQGNSNQLLHSKYTRILKKYARYTEVYLSERIEKSKLSSSELELERVKLTQKIDNLMVKLGKEEERFDKQTEECILKLKHSIKTSLDEAIRVLVVSIMNGSNLEERLNILIRNAVMSTLNETLEPQVSAYLKNIEDLFSISDLANVNFSVDLKSITNSNSKAADVAKATPLLGFIVLGVILNPIVGVLGVTLGTLADVFMNKSSKKRQEIKAEKAARELIDQVSIRVNESIAEKIRSYVRDMNNEIHQKVLKQKKVLEKSLDDIQNEMAVESSVKEKDLAKMTGELNIIKDYLNIE